MDMLYQGFGYPTGLGNSRKGCEELYGRGGVIRTHDPLRPRQVRYQAALRPDILDHSSPLAIRAFVISLFFAS